MKLETKSVWVHCGLLGWRRCSHAVEDGCLTFHQLAKAWHASHDLLGVAGASHDLLGPGGGGRKGLGRAVAHDVYRGRP